MNKLKTWFARYREKNSNWKIAGDVIFYVFIILMIIPSTRREISSFIIRVTMRKPAVEKESSIKELKAADYNLVLENMQGKAFTLDNFRNEVILLNFWATWCPPCRAEMPALQKLYEDYGDKINFVLVSNEEKEKINTFFREFGYSMPVYIQRSSLPEAFPVNSIPTTYLINRKGKVLVEKTGAADWNSEKFRRQLDEIIEE